MIQRIFSLTAFATVAVLFTSCGGSGPNVIAKNSIRSGTGSSVKTESFAIAPASSAAVAAAAG